MTNSANATQANKVLIHFVPDDMDVEAPLGAKLVDVAMASGADLTFGCRKGTCGTCRVKIASGSENTSAPAREEADFLKSLKSPPNERLACQIRILGNVSIDYPERKT
jgi:ferredoxin